MKLNKIFKKKKIIIFLLDKNNNWIESFLRKHLSKFTKKYQYKISKNIKLIKNKIVFVLSYTKILKDDFLQKNKEVLILHPSNLPKDKGFAPVQYQVLRNRKLIHVSLIKASKKVDAGPVAIKDKFFLKGHELSNEIRKMQALAIFRVVNKFLKKYPNIAFKEQKGLGTFNKRRNYKDSELKINKSLKSQFNLLRIVDNKLYPAFFRYRGNTYIIKIFKNNDT
jgi:methionyl-tRNA formyltransferase